VVQMGQAGIILRRIHALCQEQDIPPMAVFSGDFNSTPRSGICEFIKLGEMDCYMANRQTLSGQLESQEKGWPPGGGGGGGSGSGRRTSDGSRVRIDSTSSWFVCFPGPRLSRVLPLGGGTL